MELSKRYIVMPDSFKGTLSAQEVCDVIKERIVALQPDALVTCVPIADGGEGTVDAFLSALGGEKKMVLSRGPYGEEIEAYYAGLPDGETAVVELASCAGLPMVENRLAPDKTSTYGVGLMIKSAIESGYRRIILGLGGSCTNDGGTGLAAALGVVFYDETHIPFLPVGGTLHKISSLDLSPAQTLLKDVSITVMCDVDNPLLGERGAAAVFAPQKGADPDMVSRLERELAHYADVLERDTGKSLRDMPGGGAAGGAGAGICGMLGGKLVAGIDVMLDAVHFDRLLSDCQAVFTGEGQFDSQSLGGKAVIGISRRCLGSGVPVIVLTGSIGGGLDQAYREGVTAVFSINTKAEDFSVSRYRSRENLITTVDNVLRLFLCKREGPIPKVFRIDRN